MDKETFRKQQKKKSQASNMRLLGLLLGAVAVVALVTTAIVFLTHRPSVNPTPPFGTDGASTPIDVPSTTAVSGNPENPYTRKEGYYTFLLAGVDTISKNTDVLMLASLDTNSGEIHIVQIPRDTFINREVGGFTTFHRVNAVFTAIYNRQRSQGKTEAAAKHLAMQDLQKRLSEALCINIDEYALINTEGFRDVIDAVGGVVYDVPQDMDYDDPEQNLYIHLKAGTQLLDGNHAEQLIRYRKGNDGNGYATGDMERVSLRGDFMISALRQVKDKIGILGMIELIPSLKTHVSTSMSAQDMVFYAKTVYSIHNDGIFAHTLTGKTVQDPATGEWHYYCLNKAGALSDINRYLNVYTADISASLFDPMGFFTDRTNEKYLYLNDYYLS